MSSVDMCSHSFELIWQLNNMYRRDCLTNHYYYLVLSCYTVYKSNNIVTRVFI